MEEKFYDYRCSYCKIDFKNKNEDYYKEFGKICPTCDSIMNENKKNKTMITKYQLDTLNLPIETLKYYCDALSGRLGVCEKADVLELVKDREVNYEGIPAEEIMTPSISKTLQLLFKYRRGII